MSRMGLLLATMAALLAGPLCADVSDGSPLAALERKLLGAWVGSGPCEGGLTIKADGTYERKRHGPGGINSAGVWRIRWDRLPPTLTLLCRSSDDAAYAGKTLDLKLVQLDETDLVLRYEEQAPARYTRRVPETGSGAGGSIGKSALIGRWQSVEVSLADGEADLELKADGEFVYEHLDVSLGWKTTIYGAWEVMDGKLVLTAQRRLHDGAEVEVGPKKSEELVATRRGNNWILRGANRPALRKAKSAAAPG